MVPGLEHRRLTSFDGTEIAYQVRGEGPAVVLANGLGGTFEAFRYVYEFLGRDYRTLCWDYRGLYGSGVPRDLETLTVAYQCDDLEAWSGAPPAPGSAGRAPCATDLLSEVSIPTLLVIRAELGDFFAALPGYAAPLAARAGVAAGGTG